MKILLLTDLPPCENYPGGLVLNHLTRFLPPGSFVCFAAINPHLPVQLSADMEWMPAHFIDKPEEQGFRRTAPFALFPDQLGAWRGWWDRHVTGPRILAKAAALGRQHEVGAVLAVLQGQTIIHLAEPLAKTLGVPLYTLVWDPLVWWIQDNAIDRWTARAATRALESALRSSEAVATASWAMADRYARDYGVRAVPVIRSHEAEFARTPAPHMTDDGALVIGFAGQVYAAAEVRQLIRSLNLVGWTVRGRSVRIRAFGHDFPSGDIPEGRLEAMGWRAEGELTEALSQCDVLYCPYPFDPSLGEVSRLSFPSKLVAYLAAGRPVILHGPSDSSPAAYVRSKDVGLVAAGQNASVVFNALDRLCRDPELYRRQALNAQAAFQADFTLRRMREATMELFGLAPDAVEPWPASTGIAALIDERRMQGGPNKPAARPNPLWLLFDGLTSSPGGARRLLQSLSSPVRKTLDLKTGWNFCKHPVEGAAPGQAEFSSGLQPWDYLAGLELKGLRRSARYLSVHVTALTEDAYALLVDKDWNQVGERQLIPAAKWWRRLWFDLSETPGAVILVIQSNAAPRRTAIRVHRAVAYSPWRALVRRVLRRSGAEAA